MSFGPLFTLRTRGRQARPDTAGELWPATAGWNDRRQRREAEPAPAADPAAPRRRAGDKPPREPGPR